MWNSVNMLGVTNIFGEAAADGTRKGPVDLFFEKKLCRLCGRRADGGHEGPAGIGHFPCIAGNSPAGRLRRKRARRRYRQAVTSRAPEVLQNVRNTTGSDKTDRKGIPVARRVDVARPGSSRENQFFHRPGVYYCPGRHHEGLSRLHRRPAHRRPNLSPPRRRLSRKRRPERYREAGKPIITPDDTDVIETAPSGR